MEGCLVGGLLQELGAPPVALRAAAAILTPAQFIDPKLAIVYARLVSDPTASADALRSYLLDHGGYSQADLSALWALSARAPWLSAGLAGRYAHDIAEAHRVRELRHEMGRWGQILDAGGIAPTIEAISSSVGELTEQTASRDLAGLFRAAWKPYDEVMADEREAPESILGDGLLRPRQFGVLFGPPGTGKSWVALDLCVAIAQGRDWLGSISTRTVRCGLISLELEIWDLRKRLMAVVLGNDADEDLVRENLYLLAPPDFDGKLDILDPKALAAVKHAIRSLGIRFLVIDTLARCHSAEEVDLRPVTQAALEIVRECDCALLFVHHARKPPSGLRVRAGAMTEMRGDTRLTADSRLIIGLERKGNLVQLTVEKTNTGSAQDPIWLAADGQTGALLPTEGPRKGREAAEARRSKLLEELSAAGEDGMSLEELVAHTDLHRRTVQRYVADLTKEGVIRRDGKTTSLRYVYGLAPRQNDDSRLAQLELTDCNI